jgi:hypothetical protein
MIEILPAPDHVVAVRMSDKVTGKEFDRLTAEIDGKLARHQRLGIFVDLVDFDGVTLEALAKDLKYNLGKLGQWKRFPREALLTDRGWVKTLAKVADPLVPQVEVRAFAPAEREQALDWAAGVKDPELT